MFCAVAVAAACTASSGWAAVVWELNPTNQNAPVGSTSHVFTAQGSQIIATGYDNSGAVGTPHELFFKNVPAINGAGEHGLGLTGTPDNELGTLANGTPANYIQLDLRSILLQGASQGQIEVGSIQSGESFKLFGSNVQGVLGAQLGGAYGSAFDDKFVAIPNFGDFKFVSIAAGSMDVLPVAFSAVIMPVPEMSAFFPIVGLVGAIASTKILRRRSIKLRDAAL